MNDANIEHLLRSLRPAAPSAELTARVERDLDHRAAELERLPNPKLDPQKKIITWGGRLTGSLYINGHSGWIDGKLEILDQVETSSGTTPDGKPLPPGQRWERRKTRKGKGLTTVFNGPVAEF